MSKSTSNYGFTATNYPNDRGSIPRAPQSLLKNDLQYRGKPIKVMQAPRSTRDVIPPLRHLDPRMQNRKPRAMK